MKCPTCQQSIKVSPPFLDATGRAFDVYSVMLYMEPVETLKINGLTISAASLPTPLGYEPRLIILTTIEMDTARSIWLVQAREYNNPDNYLTIEGTSHERHRGLFKIAHAVSEM